MDAIFEALAHPTRREILVLLKERAMTAGELSASFPVSKATMSAHFNKLKFAGLVQSESRRANVVYTLNLSTLEEALLIFMRRVGAGEPSRRRQPCAVTP